jgi:hypothetical protein
VLNACRRRPAGRALVAGVALAAVALAGCASTSGSAASSTQAPTTEAPAATEAPTSTVDPATLPQTDEKPAAGGEGFDHRARALWDAVVADDPSIAVPTFFPSAAYQQVKSINDPTSDWHDRLIAEFETDIHALHRTLGADAAKASFTGLTVPDQAVWVTPGQEYNKLPYWRVYGSRLDYSVGGVAHSLPVSSLISWRGQWYVVHLGVIR